MTAINGISPRTGPCAASSCSHSHPSLIHSRTSSSNFSFAPLATAYRAVVFSSLAGASPFAHFHSTVHFSPSKEAVKSASSIFNPDPTLLAAAAETPRVVSGTPRPLVGTATPASPLAADTETPRVSGTPRPLVGAATPTSPLAADTETPRVSGTPRPLVGAATLTTSPLAAATETPRVSETPRPLVGAATLTTSPLAAATETPRVSPNLALPSAHTDTPPSALIPVMPNSMSTPIKRAGTTTTSTAAVSPFTARSTFILPQHLTVLPLTAVRTVSHRSQPGARACQTSVSSQPVSTRA